MIKGEEFRRSIAKLWGSSDTYFRHNGVDYPISQVKTEKVDASGCQKLIVECDTLPFAGNSEPKKRGRPKKVAA